MHLDILARIRQFGIYTFFLTCSAAGFYWTKIIEVAGHQYEETLSDKEINAMVWSWKLNYLKRNPVIVAGK